MTGWARLNVTLCALLCLAGPRNIRRSARPSQPSQPSTQPYRTGRSAAAVYPDQGAETSSSGSPLCQGAWLFPPGECAPVLGAVKHSPLVGGCGPAMRGGGGSSRENEMACWRRVGGGGSG